MMLVLAILLFGFLSRVIIHVPNFTPVIALALFGGAYLNRRTAIFLPVAIMAATDLFLGLHATMPFTWASMMLIAALGLWLKARKNFKSIALISTGAAVLFFLVTNFGSWLVMYPMTIAGLQECFLAALPFFRPLLVSTLIYSAVLFGGYEILAAVIKKTRWSKILLST